MDADRDTTWTRNTFHTASADITKPWDPPCSPKRPKAAAKANGGTLSR
jgi:hypothetical protein